MDLVTLHNADKLQCPILHRKCAHAYERQYLKSTQLTCSLINMTKLLRQYKVLNYIFLQSKPFISKTGLPKGDPTAMKLHHNA